MKTATINVPRSPGGDILRRSITAFVRLVADAGRQRYRRHLSAARLRAVSDRTLKDIGIHRTEITSIITDQSGDRRRPHGDA